MTTFEQSIAEALADVLETDVDYLSRNRDFASQGIDSFLALRLVRAIEDRTNMVIEPEWLFDYPSVRDLANALDEGVIAGDSRA